MTNDFDEVTGYWLKFEGAGEDPIPNNYNYLKVLGGYKNGVNCFIISELLL